MVEGMKERNHPAYYQDILQRHYQDIVKAIKVIYDNFSAFIISPDGEISKISNGVRQGYT